MRAVDQEQDKPEGTEQHEPGSEPARQGPENEQQADESAKTQPPATGEPRGEQSPGRPNVTSPKR